MARTPFQDYAFDMALLASCPNLIITIGTFGWWSAYLNEKNGIIMYKAQVMTPVHQDDRDFFPPHWMAVSDF